MVSHMPDSVLGEDRLAAVLSEHLDQEEAALSGLMRSVQEVRVALLRNQAARLTECLALQTGAFAECEKARVSRQRLQSTLGLGSQPVQLPALVSRLGMPARGRLWSQCQRLQRLAAEVERVARANHLFARHALSLMEQVLLEVTGGEPAGQRYNRTGAAGPTIYGHIVQARG